MIEEMKETLWLNLMNNLKNKHSVIADLLSQGKVAYVDFPTHFNVGDLLIYLGTEKFFNDYSINVVYRCDYKNVRFNKLSEVDIIVFHGGGNFGDLYPQIHKVRENVVKKYPNKKIICLPQTIHFENIEEMQKSAEIFSKHNDFHLFVRDSKSYENSEAFSKKTCLMPDMAHSLHQLVSRDEVGFVSRRKKILNLVRLDIESNSVRGTQVDKASFDWDIIITNPDRIALIAYQKLIKIPFFREKAIKLWQRTVNDIYFRSTCYFSSHDMVVTDRLHGFIFACLLGKEVKLKDNSYGKNTTYMNQWLKDYPYLNAE